MKIWKTWFNIVYDLREGFSREKTFLWFVTALLGFSLRTDLYGVTSFVRALQLKPKFYQGLLDFFHSNAVKLPRLTVLWCQVCLKWLGNKVFKVNGRFVLLADGIKIPKEGHQMPGVKLMHQESNNNSKPEYIMGHSCQVVSLLIRGLGIFFSLPLAGRIHEGIKHSPNEKTTVLEKLLRLLGQLEIKQFYLIADSYYACRTMINGLINSGSHLITVVRSNAVAYMEKNNQNKKKGRGRPSKYGKKIALRDIFKCDTFINLLSPLYNDVNVQLQYCTMDLICRSAGGILLRYVWVIHPTRGRVILMCSDLNLSAPQIIELYGKRFKIEVMFRQAVHIIGVFAYKFWSKIKDRTKRGEGDEYLHKKDEVYKEKIMQKINAYNLFIQIGLIAQGIIIIISACSPKAVWRISQLWSRNNPKDKSPSEWIVKDVLKSSFPEFLADLSKVHILKKFLIPKFRNKGTYHQIINFNKEIRNAKVA